MIVSVHIAEVGLGGVLGSVARPGKPRDVPGLRYAEALIAAPLASGGPPLPPRTIGTIAAWDDDATLDGFEASDLPLARRLASGWRVRLQPVRVTGAWRAMPGLPPEELPVDDAEPVVVLTLGRLRLARARPFLRNAAPAEREAIAAPGLLASAGLARPPRLVSTFSVWRSAAEMRAYAYRQAGAHVAAVRSDRKRGFHHESAFVRFRPYRSQGSWAVAIPWPAWSAPRLADHA